MGGKYLPPSTRYYVPTQAHRKYAIIAIMRKPIFIRPLTEDEERHIQAGLHSSDAFILRRCQILLANQRGEPATAIALQLGCDDQTVRNVIHGFNANGLAVLQEGSCRPHHLHTAFTDEGCQQLQDLLSRSPRDFGKDRDVWTLELAAQVSFEQGLRTDQLQGLTNPLVFFVHVPIGIVGIILAIVLLAVGYLNLSASGYFLGLLLLKRAHFLDSLDR